MMILNPSKIGKFIFHVFDFEDYFRLFLYGFNVIVSSHPGTPLAIGDKRHPDERELWQEWR